MEEPRHTPLGGGVSLKKSLVGQQRMVAAGGEAAVGGVGAADLVARPEPQCRPMPSRRDGLTRPPLSPEHDALAITSAFELPWRVLGCHFCHFSLTNILTKSPSPRSSAGNHSG